MENNYTINIVFEGHEVIKGVGLVLKFDIDGTKYRRVSMLTDVNGFKKGQLLWWKKNDSQYLKENEVDGMENMAEVFFMNSRVYPDLRLN